MKIDSGNLTALMPVKNYHPRFLRESLASVFAQSSPSWRLIVIVENQIDSCLDSILSEAQNDLRVKVVINQGVGLGAAFNSGMRAAESDFVAILLSDDLWTPNAIEALESSIRTHPEVELHHSGLQVIDGHGRSISGARRPPQHVSLDDFPSGSPVKHLICWRRSKALSSGGMYESRESVGPNDYDFPWTMLEHGAAIRALGECLYLYRDHREAYRITTHLPRNVHIRALRQLFERHRGPAALARKHLRQAKQEYFRQCLFRNGLDRWWHEQVIATDPAKGWRLRMRWTSVTTATGGDSSAVRE
jgi:glycosyltransferase involved in cell wall biosynthesis